MIIQVFDYLKDRSPIVWLIYDVGILNGCDHPTDLRNRRLLSINLKNGPRVNGKYPEGTGAYFRCELGFGSRIIHHPSVCQPNGDWIPTSRCEGNRFRSTDLS